MGTQFGNFPAGSLPDHSWGPESRTQVLMMGGFVATLAYAARVGGEIQACEVRLGLHRIVVLHHR
jgi:hypothetical protein